MSVRTLSAAEQQPAAEATAANIAIDLVAPVTGPRKDLGESMVAAARIAVDSINAAGGIKGATLGLRIHNDKCSSRGAAEVAGKLASMTPASRIVIGMPCTSVVSVLLPRMAERGITTLITPITGNEQRGPPAPLPHSALRLPAQIAQGEVLGAYLAENAAAVRIAFVRDGTLQARALFQAAYRKVKAAGKRVGLVAVIRSGEKDFSALLQKLESAQVTHVALAAYPSEAGLLLAQASKLLPQVRFIGVDWLASSDVAAIAGAAVGRLEVFKAPDEGAFPQARGLIDALAAKGMQPSRSALASHAAVEAAAAALGSANGLQGTESPAEVLRRQTVETVMGPLTFTDSGNASIPAYIRYQFDVQRGLIPVEIHR